ncbi:Repair protein Rad1/Rec1/Rad17-like protein [Elsinoe fawcettii]|nr:Repair protein Rad1/Rec1/Rad17-like protein [Elsinoe fawcettii]
MDSIPLFTATFPSARQLYHLLRTISFGTRVRLAISSETIRFSVLETSVLEASISLPSSLFTSYRLSPSHPSLRPTGNVSSTNYAGPEGANPSFTLPLNPLLSTLQILSSTALPDTAPKGVSGPYGSDAYSASFAAHRLTRHSVFSPSVLGTQGAVRIVYRAAGAGLELSVPETGGLRTSAELSTYVNDDAALGGEGGDAEGRGEGEGEGIPFDRGDLRIKVILPASVLGDAVGEIGALGPPDVFVVEGDGTAPYLVLRGEGGSGGECRVEFGDEGTGGMAGGYGSRERSKLLETFLCEGRVRGRYAFGTIRKGLNAMRAGSKVSLRIDGQGVLSLQFLIEMGEEGRKDDVAFVDFRVVPLWEDGEDDGDGSDDSE